MSNSISVVIPVYNGGKFIAKSVKSALEQTCPPYEVIVVNDGSTDNTLEVLKEFEHKIKLISIPNGGVSNARNVGILASKGDLVAFLDADDEWLSSKLEHQVLSLEAFPEVGFSCCNYRVLNKYTGEIVLHFSSFNDDESYIFDSPLKVDPFELLLKRNFVGTASNVIIRRSVLERVGLFNTGYRQAEDYELWLRCALATKMLIQSACLLEKNTHTSNLTNDYLDTLLCHEQVLISLKDNPYISSKINQYSDTYYMSLAKTRYEIGNLYYECGSKFKAFTYFSIGLRTLNALENYKLFSYYSLRKMARMLTFNLLKNNVSNKNSISSNCGFPN